MTTNGSFVLRVVHSFVVFVTLDASPRVHALMVLLLLWLLTGSEYVDYDNYVFYGLAKGGILFPLLLLAILLVAFILLLVATNWRLYMYVVEVELLIH